jgi:glycine cleavage system H protein
MMQRRRVVGNREIVTGSNVSRRQFLKSAGIVVGGTAIVSLGLGEGCKPQATTTSVPPNSTPASGTDTATGITTPTMTSATTSNPATSGTSATSSSVITPVATYNYIPPTAIPPLIKVGDTACNVADDGRKYSADNVWVKSLSASVVVMGITETYVENIAFPNQISLSKLGAALVSNGDNSFATVEGSKLTADIITPISGTVIQVNDFLLSFNTRTELEPLMVSPWGDGWLVVVQMSKPDELKALLTATQYRDLLLKK